MANKWRGQRAETAWMDAAIEADLRDFGYGK